ncbi:hypothetical protein PRUB_a0526 [Pseudoalteromonas rubra]|uniref:Uncharacterized protein n=1 Tax=Pseudoalteromonas rubra TaxID=43658 RepID=A0A8T0C7W9_9GAMM|nr:hypothetical protein PRUB_a0526 [Pseudoalteromonas rubra]
MHQLTSEYEPFNYRRCWQLTQLQTVEKYHFRKLLLCS